MKRYVTVAVISGALSWTNLRPASGALTVEWGNRLLSNTGIQNAYLGRGSSIQKLLLSPHTKANPFFPEFGTVVISIASIRNTSKSLSLLVR